MAEENEPAGTDPVADEAERERRQAAYSFWWRHKLLSAARQGVYPVDQDGFTVVPEWLADALDQPADEAEK